MVCHYATSRSLRVHVDTDSIHQPTGPREEPDDAAAVLHWDAEGRALPRLAERPVLAEVGDERERPDDAVVVAERTVRPGDLLDHLRRAEHDLLATKKERKKILAHQEEISISDMKRVDEQRIACFLN
jgi:hypothetical protein